MLLENTLFGVVDKVAIAIERLKTFEPAEGYYGAFSGGKDSCVIKELAKMAGVKVDWHYPLTTVDPPELVQFIKREHKDVEIVRPEKTMWQLIASKGLPNKRSRYCCEYLKEQGGEGRICVTGVRWAESSKRKHNCNAFQIFSNKKTGKMLFNDNDDERRLFENCTVKGKRIINPIIDWTEKDVWDYLNGRGIPHCSLYDEGFARLGCIGCPLTNEKNILKEFKRWPKYYDGYYRAVERFVPNYLNRCEKRNAKPFRETAQEWMDWWTHNDSREEMIDDQTVMVE